MAIEFAINQASDKQRRFMRTFFSRQDDTGRRCDVFAAIGGNRSGKSFACGWLCFALYLRDHAKDGDWFWCVGQNLDRSVGGQQQELWKALPRWMFGEQRWDAKIGFGAHRAVSISTHDGGKCLVEFRSADQEAHTFEQAKLTGAWIDERVSETIYNRLLPRIIDRNGWILYSDIPEQWWQFERLQNAEADAGVYWQGFDMHDNEHNLPEGAIVRTSAKMTADERRQRISGEFMVMEGVVYKEFVESIHVIDPFIIPSDWTRWRSLDYGGSAPTACGFYAMAPNGRIYIYREFYERSNSIEKNAQKILEMSGSETFRDTFIDPHAFDISPANEMNVAQQYAKFGLKCRPWPYVNVMGERAMVQKVKFRLEHEQLKVFRACVNFRREFRSWKYKMDKDGKPLASDAYENDNNHLLDGAKGFISTGPLFEPGKITVVG